MYFVNIQRETGECMSQTFMHFKTVSAHIDPNNCEASSSKNRFRVVSRYELLKVHKSLSGKCQVYECQECIHAPVSSCVCSANTRKGRGERLKSHAEKPSP